MRKSLGLLAMLSKAFFFAVFVANVFATGDMVAVLRAPLPRFLWLMAIWCAPGIGAALWFYAGRSEPRRRRLRRQAAQFPQERQAQKVK